MEQWRWVAILMLVAVSLDWNIVAATRIPRVMAVTETPFGAATSGASFSCLVSTMEENSTSVVQRYVRQGEDPNTYTLDLPTGHLLQSPSPEIKKVYLPFNDNAPGTYTCRIFKNGQNHDVPVTLLSGNRRFESKDGIPTLTVNVGERADLIFENVVSVLTTETIWKRLSNFNTVRMGGTAQIITGAGTADEDVYGCYLDGLLDQARLGMLRLIVRACPEGKWMPPHCAGICDQCFNGGVCDDITGECICAPGFTGPNCLQICNVNRFGWDCEYQCGSAQPLSRCAGSHMCLPDPYGCSCAAGYHGTYCTEACLAGMFGAGCTQECHCSVGDCMAHSGECIDLSAGCMSGWSGENCQIPDVCPAGYFGSDCTEKCHCEDDEPCDKETGYCTSTEGNCAPGFMSSTGINLENCQQFVGCHSECTRTCHCSGGESDCIMDDTPTSGNGMCISGMCAMAWTGTNCESGIIEETSNRANPGQSVTVTCAAINSNLDANFDIYNRIFLKQGSPSSVISFAPLQGSRSTLSLHGGFFAYAKLEYSASGIYQSDRLFCVHETDDNMAVGEVTLDFYVLPVLSSPPVLIDSGETWLTILWQAWNSSMGDVGEGPVVSYSLYLKEGSKEWTMELSVPHTDNVTDYMWNVSSLVRGSQYLISVSVSREGLGGEGERSTPLSVTVGTPLPATDVMTTSPTSNNQPESNPMTSNTTVIIFAFLCVILVFLLLVLTLTLFFKRRSKMSRKKEFELARYRASEGVTFQDNGVHSEAFVDEVETEIPLRNSIEQNPLPAKPIAAIKPIQSNKYPPVPMDEFPSYFWSSIDDGLLQKQWEFFPEEMTQPCIVAKKETNKQRNRYRNILPYEHNRVILKDGDDSEDGYINASYIKGFSGAVTYIASQGPNTASVCDFWKMIWQEDVGKIVMATNLFEEGKNKCYKYWPDVNEGELVFGSILVRINNEKSFESCVQRQITITMGQNSRSVTHFQYVDWPDKNIPRNTFSVLRFLDVVKTTPSRMSGPTLVHCSAGAGRSGVFLALDIQQERVMNTMDVDIFNCVLEMRAQRPLMVQTLEQYVFVHRLIMEWLLCKNTFVMKEDLSVYNTKLHEVNPETGESEMTTQFKILSQILPAPKRDTNAAGLLPENAEKNRDPSIIPLNRFRPFLITEVDVPGSTNYINASFIDGISSQSEFITTQMPLPNTILDFWRMVHDYQIKTLVFLNSMDKKDETCQPYWGMGEPLVCNNLFRITTTAVQKKGEIVERTFALENMLSKTVLEVKQFQLKRWPNHDVRPLSMARFVLFVQLVKEYLIETNTECPLLVHCMNGVGRSGIFCAVLSCLKQFDSMSGVDVVQTVKQLKQCQPLFVRTEEEFCLIYDLITLYVSPEACLEQADVYANLPAASSVEQLDSETLYENLGFKTKEGRPLSHSESNA